jgi:uncharacterized membrane protein YqiK
VAKKKEGELSEDQRRKKAEAFLKTLDAGKRKYKDADKLLEELLAGGMKAGDSVEISGNRKVTVIDNFADKNSHYKTVRVGRYGLDVSFTD